MPVATVRRAAGDPVFCRLISSSADVKLATKSNEFGKLLSDIIAFVTFVRVWTAGTSTSSADIDCVGQIDLFSMRYVNKNNSTAGPFESRQICREKSLFKQSLVYQMPNRKMFGLENDGNSHEVQHSQLRRSIVNIKIYVIYILS